MIFSEDIKESLIVLNNEGILLYPTDTIWGLGCDATNQAAVEKIYNFKNRLESKNLLILVDGIGMLERYVINVPGIAYELIDVSDNPLTIIYPEGKNLAKGICSTDGSVGIRICHDEFCNELIGRFRKPIVSTSANFSGKPSPRHFGDIDKEIINGVGYVVKYRQDDRRQNTSSPVIKLGKNGTIEIIRK
jgi:L-threonylcarbamoyladenylate synthase